MNIDQATTTTLVKGVIEAIGLIIGYLKIRDHLNRQEKQRQEHSRELNSTLGETKNKIEETHHEVVQNQAINVAAITASNNFNEKLVKIQGSIEWLAQEVERQGRDIGALADATGIPIRGSKKNVTRRQDTTLREEGHDRSTGEQDPI